MRKLFVLFFLAVASAQWILLEKSSPPLLSPDPDAKPAPAKSAALWFDGEDDVYLFNGHMWRYEIDNKRWLWEPEPPVSNRSDAAYWTIENKFYLYGGRQHADNTILGDMWTYEREKRTFTRILEKSLPCEGAAFWKHETTNRLYMWGGTCNATLRAFDINTNTWTENVPTHDGGNGIPKPAKHASATLGPKDTAYLYTDDKLWQLDMLKFTWTQSPIKDKAPPGPQRTYQSLWTSADGDIMLYGGRAGSKNYVDTWRYAGGQWNLEDVGNGPSPRYGSATCTDFSGNLLLFGPPNDLWKYGKFTVRNIFQLIEWKLDSATLAASVAAVMSSFVFFGIVIVSLVFCVRRCIKRKRQKSAFGEISEPVLKRHTNEDYEL